MAKVKGNKDPVCVQAWAGPTQPVGSPTCVAPGSTYTIAGLMPGTYRVSATAKKGALWWYAAATSYASATPVVVGSGTTVTGIDVPAKPKIG